MSNNIIRKYIIHSLLFYGIMESVIFFTSKNLLAKDIRVCLLQGIIVLLLSFGVQFITKKRDFFKI